MYKSVYYEKSRELLHLWDDELGYVCQKFKNYAFSKSEFGKFQTMSGQRVDKVYTFGYENQNTFEADFPVETKALIEIYGHTDEPAKNIKTLIIDIETDSTGGFPNMDTFDKEITALSYYDKTADQYKCLILDKENRVTEYKKDNVEVLSYDNEESLLKAILRTFEEIRPDIVTGWNISWNGDNQGFDIPYIYGRISRVLGDREASRLSEIGQCYVKKRDKSVVIGGVNCLDYMMLYKKFRFEPRPTYRLDYIGKLEVGKGKIHYTGSLNQLYKEDINKFIEYNLCDVQIVKMLDDQFKFLDLAVSICTVGHVPYEWFHLSSRFIEGAIINYMRKNGNMVAPNKPVRIEDDVEEQLLKKSDEDDDDDRFTGAYVKDPIPNLYSWVFSADINSLYPSTIRTLNISPETYIGKVENWNPEEFFKGNIKEIKIGGQTYSDEQFKQFIKDECINISSIGALYTGKKLGIVPSILELWFDQRIEFQNLAKKYGKEGNKEQEAYYTRRQHCQKIFLNSVYGILGLSSSRLYNKDNAESTTISGQTIIKSSEKIVIEHFKQIYAKYGKTIDDTSNIVQYIDTDSVYISVDEIGNLEGIKEEDKKEYTKKFCLDIVDKLNGFYPVLSKKFFNSDNNKIKIAADTINETALWKKKKAYALNQVHDMSKGKDVNKIKVVGLSSVRSDFPIKFKEFLEKFLKDILYRAGETKISKDVLEIKDNINSYSVLELAKNTSVKFQSEATGVNFNPKNRTKFSVIKGATAQCKAALMYNDLLIHFKLNKKVEPIYHGQKIKYVYLKDNPWGMDALAIKGDDTDPREIMDIIESYCDKKRMYTAVLENKIEDFYQILGWKMPSSETTKAEEFFSF
jgi:DNA polymerase elongation subunit (family B)